MFIFQFIVPISLTSSCTTLFTNDLEKPHIQGMKKTESPHPIILDADEDFLISTVLCVIPSLFELQRMNDET